MPLLDTPHDVIGLRARGFESLTDAIAAYGEAVRIQYLNDVIMILRSREAIAQSRALLEDRDPYRPFDKFD